ncbi:regulator of chromosome condensation 1/beta-lactamase-inhibitor protein II [Scheffersomyces xylosifermentans]|uniref:regulator of chromosome condensation 1/beta-lactamase-inhibitor protein II n=1 Tax=Scheffersomyces xylosifermentans TaxID=1304137 RepID=UPI00315D3E8F
MCVNLKLSLQRVIKRLHYSSKDKYKSIDEFNKSKTKYRFGDNFNSLEDLDKEIHPNAQEESSAKIDEKFQEQLRKAGEDDINAQIENDPRLANLTPGSPEYKEQLHIVHEDIKDRQKKRRKRFEFNERLKGVALGALALVVIIGGHRIFMNYEYIKNTIFANITYKIDEDKVKDLTDPSRNTKKLEYLISKLAEEVNDEMIKNLQNSEDVAGLYVFGSQNKSKFPTRVNFFDGQLLKDVKILNDYFVVVNEKGQLYEFHNGLKEPKLIKLPFKAEKCEISNNIIYILTNKGEVAYLPRADKIGQVDQFEGLKSRSWIGTSYTNNFNKLQVIEPIKELSAGASHILFLGKSGKLFMVNTDKNGQNYGQFGLPTLAPSEAKEVPVNEVFELTLLNNEIQKNKDGSKTIIPRTFSSIAAGSYHNVAVDTAGNVWTWGKNSHGECGIETSYNTDYQPIPRKILTKDDYKTISRNILPKNAVAESFRVESVKAANESSFIHLKYVDPDDVSLDQHVLLSFGNGIKGQLGINRYLHVCSQPQIIRSLLKLSEYSEERKGVRNIGIKNLTVGTNHAFVTLDNDGKYKDVLVFGDNEHGQFGNGKSVKSSKPLQLPKLIEPQDIDASYAEDKLAKKKLCAKVNDVNNGRLQLLEGHVVDGKEVEQVVVAGENCSAIFYRRI